MPYIITLNYSFFYSLELIVTIAICSIIFVIALFLTLTIFKKFKRLKETKIKEAYQLKIDHLLFDFLFTDKSTQEVITSSAFQKYFKFPLFQKVAIKSIIALQHNYTGIYSSRLEKFYLESGLYRYSLNKLDSNYWPDIVEGIRDLSTLNYQKSYAKIVSFKNHKNNFIVFEAIFGMIKLKGITEILKFKDATFYLNDWVQSNILFNVKKYNIPAPPNLLDLLGSKNPSVVLLAVRLINHYKFANHYSALSTYYQNTNDKRLKQEISFILRKTEQLN